MPKPSKVTELGCAFVLGLSLSMLSQTSLAANEDVLVTDPDTLEAMGFERDAENVYMAPGVDLGSGFESGLAPVVDLDAQTSLLSSSGTTGYATVSPSKFSGTVDRPGEEWAYTTFGSSALSRQGAARFAEAQFDGLPHGGILEFFSWWWRDFDPASVMAIFLFEVCTSPSAGTLSGLPTFTTIASGTSADDPIRFRAISIPSRPIDTFRCFYSVRVRFDEATTSLVFVKARLRFIHP